MRRSVNGDGRYEIKREGDVKLSKISDKSRKKAAAQCHEEASHIQGRRWLSFCLSSLWLSYSCQRWSYRAVEKKRDRVSPLVPDHRNCRTLAISPHTVRKDRQLIDSSLISSYTPYPSESEKEPTASIS